VSYGHGTRKTSQTRGLIRYLRRHHHTTPSEMVELKFHCVMPIFVARQFIRHRTASVNELSGRYSLMPLLFYRPDAEQFELQSRSNRQGREGTAPAQVYDEAVRRWDALRRDAGGAYAWLLGQDVARELARIDLPLSMYTQWYWKTDLHNLIHFLTLRADPRAQWEIQQYARVMAGMMKRVAPLTYEAWIDYDFTARAFTRAEREALARLLEASPEGVRARDGALLSKAELAELGLSGRELAELIEKLQPPECPDFELDLRRMRSAEEVGREMEAAVPGTKFE
jgi:thymidylate synthase (FAD)